LSNIHHIPSLSNFENIYTLKEIVVEVKEHGQNNCTVWTPYALRPESPLNA